MANHLAQATSPYLLQHAHNPVDWYPWGEEALSRARVENKPMLLSIGYSACHWCHVMAHESFENEATARLMNENFINIKVDREERPDLDNIYMAAVQSLTGHGGWPLTVFLTPDGRPFYGGTYFTPDDRHGLPSFSRVLEAVAASFRERPKEINRAATQLAASLNDRGSTAINTGFLSPDLLQRAFQSLAAEFDRTNAGFGDAPKFPQPLALEFLLRYFKRTGDKTALDLVEQSLESMFRGGIYDHLGGGFHRYATDAAWQVPHFEKMLYDNAQLSQVYLHTFQITGKPLYRFVAEETLDYVLREMTEPDSGGFYSSQDADSEGVEGKYYVWATAEINAALGRPGAAFRERYGVTAEGNFEGGNILHLAGEISLEALEQDRAARNKLRLLRDRRVPPGKDTKVLLSWNAMMVSSLAQAGRILGRLDYLAAAEKNAGYILDSLMDGIRLKHTASVDEGFLEDYAQLIDSLLWLHQATLQPRYLRSAIELSTRMAALFWDDASSIFYDTSSQPAGLFTRPRSLQDGAVPSGAASAALVLLKMARLADNQEYWRIGGRVLVSAGDAISRYPLGFGQWLAAADFFFGPSQEVAIIGAPEENATEALIEAVFAGWRPNTVTAGLNPEDSSGISSLPLFKDRPQIGGLPTAYVCRNFNCFPPATSADELRQVLDKE